MIVSKKNILFFIAIMMSLGTATSCGETGRKAEENLEVRKMHSCRHADCRVCAAEFKAVCPPMPEVMDLPDAGGRVASSSERLVSPHLTLASAPDVGIAYVRNGKMQALHDFRIYVDVEGKEDIVPLDGYLYETVVIDDMLIRKYNIDDIEITEAISAGKDSPVAILHYQWEGNGLRNVFADFKSDLGSIKRKGIIRDRSLEYGWSPELNAMVVRDFQKSRIVLLGANVPGMEIRSGHYGGFIYESRRIRTVRPESHQVASCIEFSVAGLDCLDMVVAATDQGQERLLYDYAAVLRNPAACMR